MCAHVDLFVGVDGFGIAGYLNFDTLIERNPFYFDGDTSGGVMLSVDGDNVMSLDLSADLTGPARQVGVCSTRRRSSHRG